MNNKLPVAIIIAIALFAIASQFIATPAAEGGLIITGFATADSGTPSLTQKTGFSFNIEGDVYNLEIDADRKKYLVGVTGGEAGDTVELIVISLSEPSLTPAVFNVYNTGETPSPIGQFDCYYAIESTIQGPTLVINNFSTQSNTIAPVSPGAYREASCNPSAYVFTQSAGYEYSLTWVKLVQQGNSDQPEHLTNMAFVATTASDILALFETVNEAPVVYQPSSVELMETAIRANAVGNPFVILTDLIENFITGDLPGEAGGEYGGTVSLPGEAGGEYGGTV